MSTQLEVRPYRVGDEKEIVDLLIASFPGWIDKENPYEYWNWKYKSPINEPIIAIALTSEKIVGCSHDIIINVKIGDKIYEANVGDDLATHPDYRGRGVMGKIGTITGKMVEDRKIKFAYSIPISPTVLKSHMRSGRVLFPHKISHMYLVKDIKLHLSKKKFKNATMLSLGFQALRLKNHVKNIFTNYKAEKASDISITEIKRFDERVNNHWEKTRQHYDFIIEKKRDHLNWRYCDPRGDKYRILVAEKKDEVIGYLISETKKHDNYSEEYIVDLLTQPNRLDIFEELLENFLRRSEAEAINAIHYLTFTNSEHRRIVEKHGFIDTSIYSGINLSCDFQKIEEDYKTVLNSTPDKVYFGFGDYF